MNRRRSSNWAGALLATAALLGVRLARSEVVPLVVLERTALQRRSSLVAQDARTRAAEARLRFARSGSTSLSFVADAALAPGNTPVRIADVHGNEYLVPGSRALGQEGAFLPTVQYNAGLRLDSRLYDFGRTHAAIGAASADLAATRAGTEAERRRIVHEVRIAYLGWAVAHASTAIARNSSENARKQRRLVEVGVEEGSHSASDLPLARADEARAELRLVEAKRRLMTARLGLEGAVEDTLSADAEPDPKVLDTPPPLVAPSRSPQLDVLERRRDTALANARSHGQPYLPVLDGVAEVGPRGQAARVFAAYRVGILLSVPLWDGGALSAQTDASRAEASELSAQAQELERSLARDRAQAVSDLTNADERLRIANTLRFALEESERLAEERYAIGGPGTLETVLQARAAIADALLEVLQARAARVDAVFRLMELPKGAGTRP